jgi:hypothetical protein
MVSKRVKPDDVVISLMVDDELYTLNMSAVNYKHEMALYRETNLTLSEIIGAFADGRVAPFMTAAIVYLARLQAGDSGFTFDSIASQFEQFTPVEWMPEVKPSPKDPETSTQP